MDKSIPEKIIIIAKKVALEAGFANERSSVSDFLLLYSHFVM